MLEKLSPREREIFDLLLEGVSPKEIAYKLNITHHTIAFHRTKLYNKLGVQSIQELFAKYSDQRKTQTGIIIPAFDLGFYPMSDSEMGGNSTSEIFITQEEIDEVVNNSVLNIKTNLVKAENNNNIYYANIHTQKLNKQLRNANGIRFKARGDGKSWVVEFQTMEFANVKNFVYHVYTFSTIREKIINVDIPYSKVYFPDWLGKHSFDFKKEKINNLVITASFLQGYGSSLLQIFDFEIY